MKVDRFPFISLGGIARPMLWVRISTVDGAKRTRSLLAKVEPGADACFFPSDVAEELGYNLKSAVPVGIETIIGTGKAYLHRSIIEILEMLPDGSAGERVLYRIPEVLICFVENSKSFVLGARDFLSSFVLTVDYSKQFFSLTSPESHNSQTE